MTLLTFNDYDIYSRTPLILKRARAPWILQTCY